MPSKFHLVLSAAALSVLGAWNAPLARAAELRPAVGVSIDWQALDALPPAAGNPATEAIVLRPPPPPPKLAAAPAVALARPLPQAPKSSSVPAAAAVSPPPPPPKTAALPAVAPAVAPGRIGMVSFAKGAIDVPPDSIGMLNSVAQQLAQNAKARLQLIAHASGSSDDALEARRVSLARAVQMRAYLIEKGVPSVRMDVRALGDRNAGDGPADRVDLVIVER